jgi:hypothetical protein
MPSPGLALLHPAIFAIPCFSRHHHGEKAPSTEKRSRVLTKPEAADSAACGVLRWRSAPSCNTCRWFSPRATGGRTPSSDVRPEVGQPSSPGHDARYAPARPFVLRGPLHTAVSCGPRRPAGMGTSNPPPSSTCRPPIRLSLRSPSTNLLGPARRCHHCWAATISRGGGIAVAGQRRPACAACRVVVKGVRAARLGIDRIGFRRGGRL